MSISFDRGAESGARPRRGSHKSMREPRAGYRLFLLDDFCLRGGASEISLSHAGERLVAYLALNPTPIHRRTLANVLWIDSDEDHAATSLRTALWRVRSSARGLIESANDRLRLGADVGVDVRETVRLSREAIDNGGADDGPIDVASLTGELLPGWSDDWVVVERERARQLQLHALEALCRIRARQANYIGAIEAGLAAVAVEPLRETAHRALIDAHLAEGNRSEAIRQYAAFRTLLATELGVAPSHDLEQLLWRDTSAANGHGAAVTASRHGSPTAAAIVSHLTGGVRTRR